MSLFGYYLVALAVGWLSGAITERCDLGWPWPLALGAAAGLIYTVLRSTAGLAI